MYAYQAMKALGFMLLVVSLPMTAASHSSTDEPLKIQRGPRRGLIHPLLDTKDVEFKELKPFEYRLAQLRDRLKAEKKITMMAIYFRDLDNGMAFGVDGQEKFQVANLQLPAMHELTFQPASLLKLPIMMAILHKHENDPLLLSRGIALKPTKPGEVVTTFPPSKVLVPGREYPLDELLRAMIARSDNDALNTLLSTLSEADYLRVYEDFGLRIPNVRDTNDPVTVREYATFFRILYNASYLTKEMSQKALEYLADSEFDLGLEAGIPKGLTIAHKFGESGRVGSSERQLHDCGIIYHPFKPYILCVMTRGADMKTQAAAIAEVSRLVYGEVDSSSKAEKTAR